MYGTAALSLKNSDIADLSRAYDSVFVKMFKVKTTNTIRQCQYYSGFWPVEIMYDFNRFNFLNALKMAGRLHNNLEIDVPDYIDYKSIENKYGIAGTDSKTKLKYKFWKYFEAGFLN